MPLPEHRRPWAGATPGGAASPAPAPSAYPVLHLWLMALLRAASRGLDRWAAAVERTASQAARARRPPPVAVLPSVEFHAEAGAPEGALYIDGEYIGRIEGVRRL